jgi:hypothetical protein
MTALTNRLLLLERRDALIATACAPGAEVSACASECVCDGDRRR